MHWLVKFLNRFFYPYFIFDDSGELYLARYRLFRTALIGLYLHHIVQSDEARHLHDHPWDFITVIIKGPGYYELLPGGMKPIWPRRPNRHKAEDLHAVRLFKSFPRDLPPREQPVWTLFLRFRRRREWGFQLANGWVSHRNYKELKPLIGYVEKVFRRRDN